MSCIESSNNNNILYCKDKKYKHIKNKYTLDFFSVLRTILAGITIWRTVIFIYIIANGIFHTNKYTYWNYTMQWLFDICFLVAIICPGRLILFLSVRVYPMIIGSSFLVSFIIVVIIQRNDWDYIEDTIFGLGEYHIGDIHTADWIVHVSPLIERLILGIFGQMIICRSIININYHFPFTQIELAYEKYRNYKGIENIRILIFEYIWWIISPLIPLIIFSLFHNPLKEYPTGFTAIQAIIIVTILCISVQTTLFLFMVSEKNFELYLGNRIVIRRDDDVKLLDSVSESYLSDIVRFRNNNNNNVIRLAEGQ